MEAIAPLVPYDHEAVTAALEDYALRRAAVPLRPLDHTPVVSPIGHPARRALCDVCGAPTHVLNHCGRPLCVPCQRKRVARAAPIIVETVLNVQAALESDNLGHNKRRRTRFVTVTLKNVPLGALASAVDRSRDAWQCLRRRKFWTDCDVWGDIPRIEFTLSGDALGRPSWHVHVHAIVVSGFMPAGPDAARPGEGNLRDEWFSITGDSMIVDVRAVNSAQEAAAELVKYVFKPTDDQGAALPSWPEGALREAAAVLAGPYRVGWYCPTHRTRKRADCLDHIANTPPGFVPLACEGEYRLERQGFRPLLPSGIFRDMHVAAAAARAARPANCPHCGLGKMRPESYWMARYRESGPRCPRARPALDQLNLIPAHEMTFDDTRPRLNLLATMPAGWIPPPEYADFRPELRGHVVDMIRNTPRDLDGILDIMNVPDTDVPAFKLALLSLERLGIVHKGRSGAYSVNAAMLARLTGE